MNPESWTLDIGNAVDRDHPNADGLVALWLLNEDAGSVAHNCASFSNRGLGTLQDRAAFVSTEGRKVIQLDGVDDYISTAFKIQDFITTEISVSWMQRPTTAFNSGGINRGMWGQLQANSTQPEFSAQVHTDNNWYVGFAASGAAHRVTVAASASNWPQNAWSEYTFTAVSGGTSRFYQNGVLLASNGGTTTFQSPALFFEIGRLVGTRVFAGQLKNLMIWNRELPINAIKENSRESRADFRESGSLINWINGTSTHVVPEAIEQLDDVSGGVAGIGDWTLDVGNAVKRDHALTKGMTRWFYTPPGIGAGSRLLSLAGNKHGTLSVDSGSAKWTPTPRGDMGLRFLGTTGTSVICGDVPELSGTTKFSFAVEIFAYGLGGSGFGRIFTKNDIAHLSCFINSSTQIGWIAASGSITLTATVPSSTGKWITIHGTYTSGETNGSRIYIDGKLNQAITVTQTMPTDSNALWIGNRTDGAREFDGIIRNLRIWANRALTASEVALDYQLDNQNGYRTFDSPLNWINSDARTAPAPTAPEFGGVTGLGDWRLDVGNAVDRDRDINRSLAAWWLTPPGRAAGSLVPNIQGGKNPFSLTAATGVWDGDAVRFTSTSAFVAAPHDASYNFLTTEPATISCLVKLSTLATRQIFLAKGTGSDNNAWWIEHSSGEWGVMSGGGIVFTSGSVAVIDRWVSLTLRTTAAAIELYVDGFLRASSSPPSTNITNTESVRIGDGLSSGFGLGLNNGAIKDIRIARRAMRADEILLLARSSLVGHRIAESPLRWLGTDTHFAPHATEAETVVGVGHVLDGGEWTLDIGNAVNRDHPLGKGILAWWKSIPGLAAGSVFRDLLGRSDGILTSGAKWGNSVKPRIGGGAPVEFDGADDVVTVASSSPFNVGNVTVSCWVRPNSASASYGYFEKSSNGSVNRQYLLFQSGSAFFWRVCDTIGGYHTLSGGTPVADVWQMVTGTYDTSIGGFNLFVNGVLVQSDTYTQINPAGGIVGCRIGKLFGDFFPMAGHLDDILVWNRRLSAAEVMQFYRESLRGYQTNYSLLNWTESGGTTPVTGEATGPSEVTATAALSVTKATLAASVAVTNPSYTAAVTLAATTATLASAATFAPGTKTAAVTLAATKATLASAATFAPGTKTAAVSLTATNATLAAAATFASGANTAAVTLSSTNATLAAVATFTNPVYAATAALSATKAALNAAAIFAAAVYQASVSLSATKATLAATATHAPPTYTAAVTLAATKATLAAVATFTRPVYSAAAALSATKAVLNAVATFLSGTRTATASLESTKAALAATVTTTRPSYTASVALYATKAVLSAVAPAFARKTLLATLVAGYTKFRLAAGRVHFRLKAGGYE